MSRYIPPRNRNTQPYQLITGNWNKDTAALNTAFEKSNIVIIGEAHEDTYIEKLILHSLDKFKPDYFLTEHIQYLTLTNNKERKHYLDKLKKDQVIHNKYSERWVNHLLKFPNVQMVGMDYKAKTEEEFNQVVYIGDLIESFILREDAMLKDCIKYSNLGRVLVQVGDTHLRTKPCEELGGSSPLIHYYTAKEECTIFRPAALIPYNP